MDIEASEGETNPKEIQHSNYSRYLLYRLYRTFLDQFTKLRPNL
jgi:hypothetical protein